MIKLWISCIENRHGYSEKLSIKNRKYNAPPNNEVYMGPYKFVWIGANMVVAQVIGSWK